MKLILVVATITGLLMGGPHSLTPADAAVPVPFDIEDPGQSARGPCASSAMERLEAARWSGPGGLQCDSYRLTACIPASG
jgi:hypothetical protein